MPKLGFCNWLYVQKGYSALQIVSQICFNGPLVDEFDELYASLFEHHTRHVQIIRALAQKPYGLTKSQISKMTQLSAGGGMNLILEELEQSGFILAIQDFGKKKKELRYRLIDEYSLFHLKWTEKVRESNLRPTDDQFWANMLHSPLGQTWAGYAFELVCLKHLPQIKRALGIAGVLTHASGWFYQPAKSSREQGAQIDLLIDRADQCINLCKIKYCNDAFVVSKSYDQKLRQKKQVFLARTQTKKSVFLTLISPYGVNKQSGHFETIDIDLTMDSLF